MSEHDAVLTDSARVRRERPTYAVHVPAVALHGDCPPLPYRIGEIARSTWAKGKRRDGAIFYLVIDGRHCRVTLEAM